MADFEPIAVNTTAEKLEKIANMDVLTETVETENDNALVSATALLKTLVGNVDLSNYYIKLWQPNTEYKVGDVVIENFGNGYMGNPRTGVLRCIENHTSSDYFDQDYLGDSKWEQKKDVWAEYGYRDYLGNLIPEHYATKKEVGNIETALNNIIALQNSLIGGDA